MKKILVMTMGATMFPYPEEKESIDNTWVKTIDKYPNIDYIYYHEGNKTEIKDDVLLVNAPSENTFLKTIEALRYVNVHCNYEYIFRTNLTNYINIGLLNAFIDTIDNDDIVWGGEEYVLNRCSEMPVSRLHYIRGNSIILSKKCVDVLLESFDRWHSEYESLDSLSDDIMIGFYFYLYWTNQDKNYIEYIKSYGQAWINYIIPLQYTMPIIFYTIDNGRCRWTNTSYSGEYLSNFINIQTKRYVYGYMHDKRLLKLELEDMKRVHDAIMATHIDSYDDIIEKNLDYSNEKWLFDCYYKVIKLENYYHLHYLKKKYL